jgi:hypothetical protein
MMITLDELCRQKKMINEIDWDMTPERAVSMYLEWGTGWKDRRDVVSSVNDESIYFVIYDWEKEPGATLIRRTLDGAEEIARIPVPQQLFDDSWREGGRKPGGTVHPPNRDLKEWLNKLIGGPPLDLSIAVN